MKTDILSLSDLVSHIRLKNLAQLATIVLLSVAPSIFAQSFTPRDTIVGSNYLQVEFSDDSRSMVWCEQLLLSGGKATVWYADMNLNTGVPNLSARQLIDTICAQGWPYWGQDAASKFFIIKNQHGHVKCVRRTGFNTLTQVDYGIVSDDEKSLLNVSSDSTKPYFWISYVILHPDSTGRDSLFAFRSDSPGVRVFIDSEKQNRSGSAYELTFPRWMAQSEILSYPFRPFATQPYWDIKFWNGETATSVVVTDDVLKSIFNHHVDDFPFRLPQFPVDTFLSSSKAGRSVAIYKKADPHFTQVQLHSSPTTITPVTLTSFEPFTIAGNKTYGAYQVYSGAGKPGNTPGEIYLLEIFGDNLHVKISDYDGDVAVDPEFVIGERKVWIYYYGKPVGTGVYNLHRCETPLVIPDPTTGVGVDHVIDPIMVYPNPSSSLFAIQAAIPGDARIIDLLGRTAWRGRIEARITVDASAWTPGMYFLIHADGAIPLIRR